MDISSQISSKYLPGNLLNSCPTGIVCGGVQLFSEKEVILKISTEDLTNECQALKRITPHSGVVVLVELISFEKGQVLVTEKAGNMNLFEYLSRFGSFSEEDSRAIFISICETIEYCHTNGVVHADIKPENIILDDMKPIICDFGGSILLGRKSSYYPRVVSIPYTAPEVREKKVNNPKALDVWSLGVLLYTMVTGRQPITQSEWLKNDLCEWKSEPLPELLKDLLREMLKKKPNDRINIKEVLEHKWVSKEESKTIQNLSSSSTPKFLGKMVGWIKKRQLHISSS